MSRHRALRTKVRRGIAKWPVAIVGVVVLLVLGYFAYTWVAGIVDQRAAAQAGDCRQGDASLRVAATPSVADAVRQAAESWSRGRPVVYDHCIRVEVQSIHSDVVLQSLTQGWDEAALGARPHAWVTDSMLWANRLGAQNRALLGAQPVSIAASPVLLALPQEGAQAVQAGVGFRWTDLPEVTSAAGGWGRFGKPEWGDFKVAMPDPATNAATAMVIQSALAGASPDGKGPVTTEMLALDPVKATLGRLTASKPEQAPPTTWGALSQLADKPGANASGFSAVPVFEVDLFRHNTGKDSGTAPLQPLYGVAAGGPSPVADFPFVPLAGDWVGEAQVRAAQEFREFLLAPEQQRTLAGAGLRVDTTTERPKPSPGIRWATMTDKLVPADATTAQQISAAWATADNGQSVTVLVDVSKSMEEPGGDGKSRMAWVKDALSGQVNRSVSGALGLWEFSRALDGEKPYRQLVATGPVVGQKQQLLDGVAGLRPQSATQLYSSVAALYEKTLAEYQPGKRNRIIVLTDGANDGGLTFAQLKTELARLKQDGKDIAISVLAIGPDPERQPLGELTRTSGGTLSVVDDGRGVDAALAQLLSA
ncbi:substrate-binding domain-containing protein [Actinosynnema sp. NPDC047251]|uniref:von Willebrand factor type A family protein n=1 Tax=Saccharothrix espanaensis (strain ATCC 51144 / DSM 44229 / JCM 9112 / NBRC 15066 / NRRL 15764) TaxID=1179773 RepID=K0K861_SACES|nr:substrate-binding domain-containing protein [Saccharothrix espanaensis]CCH33712.1 von Willebrand factor type A family protein [Saccharothrix espanaensis DSM 44229]